MLSPAEFTSAIKIGQYLFSNLSEKTSGILQTVFCQSQEDILKNLGDDIVRNKEIPNLDQCSECNNEILTRPPKAITILSCGHTFHRICIEKKLLLTMPNTCPFPDCGKNVDIIEEFPNTNEESPISALSNRMNESLVILSSPILRMEGVENTGSQPVKGYLRCAKCSEDLSSSLPPVNSIRFPLQPQEPPKPLVYLTFFFF